MGVFDRDALPEGGGSFITWRCHAVDTSASSGSIMTSHPKTVIDLLEVPFTPTTTRDGFLDVGTPSSNNGGCIRFVLPRDAGIITSTTSLWLEHAIGGVTDGGVRRPGSMTLCLATSAGYLYRIVFQHHPSDVVVSTREEMLYGGGGGGFLRSCLGRSEPVLHGPWTLGGATVANVAQARWVDSFTLLLFSENGSSAIVKVCDPNDDEDDDDDDAMMVKTLTCLAPAPESGGISSLISWISGKSSSQCSQSTRSSVEQGMTPLDTWRTVNQSFSSPPPAAPAAAPPAAAPAAAPPAAAAHGRISSTSRREHLAGTIIETGIGLVVIVVVREENDKCGLEVWCNMEDHEGKDTWLRTCVVNGDEMGTSFVAFCRRTTVMTSCLRVEACAYGKNRSLVSVVIAVPEGGEQRHTTTTRLLRLEGVLRSSDDSTGLRSTLSLLLPKKSVAANDTCYPFHVLLDDQEVERGQINFDSSSRVVDMQLSIMDINEDALDEEAIPSLDVLLEVRKIDEDDDDDDEEEEETCMLHFDRYDGTIPRVEKTLVSSQPCCLSRRNLLLCDFNFLMEDGSVEGGEGSEERGEERGEETDLSGELPPMTADDVEEHLMRRVMIPSRYTSTTLKYAVTLMSKSTNERKGMYNND